MGKSLIIKGADFSQVSIPVDKNITPSWESGFNGYWDTGGIFRDTAMYSFIIPTTIGKSYRITCKAKSTTSIVSLSSSTKPSDGDTASVLVVNTGASFTWQTHTVVATKDYISFSTSTSDTSELNVLELVE